VFISSSPPGLGLLYGAIIVSLCALGFVDYQGLFYI
jgi:hypothetical protein